MVGWAILVDKQFSVVVFLLIILDAQNFRVCSFFLVRRVSCARVAGSFGRENVDSVRSEDLEIN